MTDKCTPGPWEADGLIVRTSRGIIAQCPVPQQGGVFDCSANARLIATAPDLLAALKHVRAIIAEAAKTGFNCRDGDWADRLFASQALTYAAVTIAEGKRIAQGASVND